MAVKIIGNKVYDTNTALKVETAPSGALYLTKNGAWFVFNNAFSDITPLQPEQAYEWLYKLSKAEAIRKYFPNRIENV